MPTYKLSVGVPGKSNAFLISAKLGIPQEIIDAARNHMSGTMTSGWTACCPSWTT